jgi:hypothetical protein
VDFNTIIPLTRTYLNAEWTLINLDIPESYSQQFGERQAGGFVDVVQPVFRKSIFGFERSVINAAVRFEYVDWNREKFRETDGKIHDDFVSVVPGLSWRPTAQTVIRLNYRYNWQTDLFGNPPTKTAGFQFGFSSYF